MDVVRLLLAYVILAMCSDVWRHLLPQLFEVKCAALAMYGAT